MAAFNEPKSVSVIIKQRQQSRYASGGKSGGKSSGGPGANINDSLNPVLPPLYPVSPKPTPLNPNVARFVKVYKDVSQYFKSNFSLQTSVKPKLGFYVDRYTDQYKSPLALKPHLLHKVPDSRYPDELSTKNNARKLQPRKLKRKIEDLPDNDDPESTGVTVKKEPEEEDEEGKEETTVEDMDDIEDDVDEEMDLGTDYAQSYFDNGEGDEDDRDDEDGAIY